MSKNLRSGRMAEFWEPVWSEKSNVVGYYHVFRVESWSFFSYPKRLLTNVSTTLQGIPRGFYKSWHAPACFGPETLLKTPKVGPHTIMIHVCVVNCSIWHKLTKFYHLEDCRTNFLIYEPELRSLGSTQTRLTSSCPVGAQAHQQQEEVKNLSTELPRPSHARQEKFTAGV